jgi:hypothetical protein
MMSTLSELYRARTTGNGRNCNPDLRSVAYNFHHFSSSDELEINHPKRGQ